MLDVGPEELGPVRVGTDAVKVSGGSWKLFAPTSEIDHDVGLANPSTVCRHAPRGSGATGRR